MNGSPVTLTVGIPTFNRKDAVTARMKELFAFLPSEHVEVLVIDNHSTDGTYEQLISDFVRPGVRVLQNTSNVGYAGNILRLIENVGTDYLLILSDEDRLEKDGFDALLQFCAERRPNFVSPRARVRAGKDYRGRTKTRNIDPAEFRASSFYISGLTFSAPLAKTLAPAVRDRLAVNSAANIYPQVLLAVLAILRGDCYFLDALVSIQAEQLDTHIAENSGGKYFSVEGRWAQFRGYEEFFADVRDELNTELRRQIDLMTDHIRQGVLPTLVSAAIAEVPELTPYLRRSLAKQVVDVFRVRLKRR